MIINFCTSEYRASHGREPKGFGSWAFSFKPHATIDDLIWVNQSTYGDAKKKIIKIIKEQIPMTYKFTGMIDVYVQP